MPGFYIRGRKREIIKNESWALKLGDQMTGGHHGEEGEN